MTIVVVGKSPTMIGKWCREVTAMASGVPDGYGKLSTGARMVCGLVPMVAGDHSRCRKKSEDEWKVVSGSDRCGQTGSR